LASAPGLGTNRFRRVRVSPQLHRRAVVTSSETKEAATFHATLFFAGIVGAASTILAGLYFEFRAVPTPERGKPQKRHETANWK
jgi:hypothetical protein